MISCIFNLFYPHPPKPTFDLILTYFHVLGFRALQEVFCFIRLPRNFPPTSPKGFEKRFFGAPWLHDDVRCRHCRGANEPGSAGSALVASISTCNKTNQAMKDESFTKMHGLHHSTASLHRCVVANPSRTKNSLAFKPSMFVEFLWLCLKHLFKNLQNKLTHTLLRLLIELFLAFKGHTTLARIIERGYHRGRYPLGNRNQTQRRRVLIRIRDISKCLVFTIDCRKTLSTCPRTHCCAWCASTNAVLRRPPVQHPLFDFSELETLEMRSSGLCIQRHPEQLFRPTEVNTLRGFKVVKLPVNWLSLMRMMAIDMRASGIVPANLLSCAETRYNFGMNATAAGMVPDNWLMLRKILAGLILPMLDKGCWHPNVGLAPNAAWRVLPVHPLVATEPLRPWWPPHPHPIHPDPILTPFRPELDPILTPFRPEFDPILTSIGQIQVEIRSKGITVEILGLIHATDLALGEWLLWWFSWSRGVKIGSGWVGQTGVAL